MDEVGRPEEPLGTGATATGPRRGQLMAAIVGLVAIAVTAASVILVRERDRLEAERDIASLFDAPGNGPVGWSSHPDVAISGGRWQRVGHPVEAPLHADQWSPVVASGGVAAYHDVARPALDTIRLLHERDAWTRLDAFDGRSVLQLAAGARGIWVASRNGGDLVVSLIGTSAEAPREIARTPLGTFGGMAVTGGGVVALETDAEGRFVEVSEAGAVTTAPADGAVRLCGSVHRAEPEARLVWVATDLAVGCDEVRSGGYAATDAWTVAETGLPEIIHAIGLVGQEIIALNSPGAETGCPADTLCSPTVTIRASDGSVLRTLPSPSITPRVDATIGAVDNVPVIFGGRERISTATGDVRPRGYVIVEGRPYRVVNTSVAERPAIDGVFFDAEAGAWGPLPDSPH